MLYRRFPNEVTGATGQELDGFAQQSQAWSQTAHDDEGHNLDGVPVGAIVDWPVSSAPARWLLCNGGAYSRDTYKLLYAVIGIDYGTGDGSTTFNVPNQAGVVGDFLIIYAGV
jgi:hypothetical protein